MKTGFFRLLFYLQKQTCKIRIFLTDRINSVVKYLTGYMYNSNNFDKIDKYSKNITFFYRQTPWIYHIIMRVI